MARKAILLGSTVLAAGLLATAAVADGIGLTIGGRYKGAGGGAVAEDFDDASTGAAGAVRKDVFDQDVEIDFRGGTTLPNGLAVGVTIELEGQSTIDQIDAVYVDFSGGWGELRFGDTDEAYVELCYLVPSASRLFGADSPDFGFSNAGLAGYAGTNGTCRGIDNRSTKLVYFSPTLAGFHFAASFTPDATEDTRNTLSGAGTRPTTNAGQNSETLSVAATFEGELGAVGFLVGGGGSFSFDKEANPNRAGDARGVNVYGQLAIDGFTLGSAVERRQNPGADGADHWVFGLGATYDWRAWRFGLGWTHGDYEDATGANAVGPFDADHDIVSATVSYALAPGIAIDGAIEYSDYRSEAMAGPDYRGIAVGIGTYIEF